MACSLQVGTCTLCLRDETTGRDIQLSWHKASSAVTSAADTLSFEAKLQQLTMLQHLPDGSQQLLVTAGMNPSQARCCIWHVPVQRPSPLQAPMTSAS